MIIICVLDRLSMAARHPPVQPIRDLDREDERLQNLRLKTAGSDWEYATPRFASVSSLRIALRYRKCAPSAVLRCCELVMGTTFVATGRTMPKKSRTVEEARSLVQGGSRAAAGVCGTSSGSCLDR
jgi:hypothetical protein